MWKTWSGCWTRATPFPSSPATARSFTAPWTTPSLRTLEERLQYLRGLEERREAVKNAIEEQGKLTEELAAAIDSAQTLAEVEDLYRPYKQKRRTRATVAREKGLEPLAALLFAQERDCPRPEDAAADYHRPGKGRGDGGGRSAGSQRHHRRVDQRRCGRPQEPAGAAGAAGYSAFPRRHGGGQRLPPVLRF